MELTEAGERRTCDAQDASDVLGSLMQQYGDRVYRLAYYHVRDAYLAEDIAQEVFCRVYRSLRRFRGDSSYFTWIYRITVNLCRDYMASAALRRTLPSRGVDALPCDEVRMFERVEGGEVFAQVMRLPDAYRTVISLYYFEDMKTEDIAKLLGISEANVRARLCRGRETLRKALEEAGE